MQKQTTDFFTVFELLDKYGVKYIIVGGVSAVLQGAPVTTFDLDLVHERSEENVDNLLKALKELEAHYRTRRDIKIGPDKAALLGPGHHLFQTNVGYLDLLGTIGTGLNYNDLLKFSEPLEVEGRIIQVQGLESLIQIKTLLGRDKDRVAISILQKTLELKQNIEDKKL